MKFYHIIKSTVFLFLCALLFILALHAEDEVVFTSQEKMKIYRQILKKENDPLVLAEAHFKIAEVLEQLGRDTEATAEYLKIILNYPDVGDFAEVAEERLTSLYNKFSKKESTVLGGADVTEQNKDPAIFFTYIKSLYETYNYQGNYDKAVHLLKKLMKIDPTNQEYYVDLGNIYLHGYNDPDTALKHFNRLIEMNPNHPRAYTDIGLAYEKKGDIENAVKYYRESIELAPLNIWSMYGILRVEALNLAKEKKLIKDWHFLGPFDNLGREGFDKNFGPEEKTELDKTYQALDGKSVSWFRPFHTRIQAMWI